MYRGSIKNYIWSKVVSAVGSSSSPPFILTRSYNSSGSCAWREKGEVAIMKSLILISVKALGRLALNLLGLNYFFEDLNMLCWIMDRISSFFTAGGSSFVNVAKLFIRSLYRFSVPSFAFSGKLTLVCEMIYKSLFLPVSYWKTYEVFLWRTVKVNLTSSLRSVSFSRSITNRL